MRPRRRKASIARCRVDRLLPTTQLGRGWVGVGRRLEKADQLADRVMAMLEVAQRKLAVDLVAVVAADPRLRQVAGLLEVADDRRDRALGEADGGRDVPETCRGVARDAFEHVGVVRHEPPWMVQIGRTALHECCYGSSFSSI